MTDGSLHGGQHIATLVGSQQRQDTLCLFQAIALTFEQLVEKRRCDFSQPGKLAAQLFELSPAVPGWSMRRIFPLLARLSAD